MQIILLPPGSQAALKLANANLSNMIKPATPINQVMGAGFKVGDGGVQSVRKRQRLDHLTEQEKLNRRKLKNRVAAQTARDKKKAKMDELEMIVQQLRHENEKLKEENKRLKLENTRLKINHGETTITLEEESDAVETMYPFESAAGTGMHSSSASDDTSSTDADSAISLWSPSPQQSDKVTCPLGFTGSEFGGDETTAENKCFPSTGKNSCPYSSSTSLTEGNIDILNWLAKTVLETEENSTLPEIKSEPVEMFDLMKYVQSSADVPDDQDESFIDDLCFESSKHEHKIREPQEVLQDTLEQTTDCPSSPCNSKEIVDYVESNGISSASPFFDEDMREPDWLSSWDS